MKQASHVEVARRVFDIERLALEEVALRLDATFENVVNAILLAQGRLVVIGMGKSGHIGKKIAATLASTGTSSFFVHPAEAFHGDLGMITQEDLILLISYSGETDEVLRLIPFFKTNKNTLISITGNANSTLAKEADHHLDIGVSKEACPLALAPTSSTTATLAMGDALAVALMEAKQFQPEDFAKFHPGGSLGRRLLHKVRDYMRREDLPIISIDDQVNELIIKLSEGRLGLVIVHNEEGKTVGIITDGDLRRALSKSSDVLALKPADLVNSNPKSISPDAPIHQAEQMMLEKKILSLLVIENDLVIGVCQLYDIYRG